MATVYAHTLKLVARTRLPSSHWKVAPVLVRAAIEDILGFSHGKFCFVAIAAAHRSLAPHSGWQVRVVLVLSGFGWYSE
jgi:hypothetical protein